MQLSSLFTDGMVLQRGKKNLIWGYTKPVQYIKGTMEQESFEAEADESGYFELELPELPAGGPYTLTIAADQKRTIKDVMVGDVFLLGGQSNMELPLNRVVELYREELSRAEEPDIRMFEVPKEYEFQEERQELHGGRWLKAEGTDLYLFSALGYFTAKALRDQYHIPIGLMQTAVGGTPAKAWCSEETIRRMGYYTKELERCKKTGFTKHIEEIEQENEQNWYREAKESFETMPLKKGTMQIPGIWRENEYANFRGTMRLTRTVSLTKEDAEKPGQILLGTVNDADVVYINGTYVGETGYKYPPRIYPIPEGVLKEGENTVEIRLSVYREHGGFMPGKAYCLRLGKERDIFINLAGKWEFELMKPMHELPQTTFFNYYASALYNGMLSPVRKWNYAAFLYYQGESNENMAEHYTEEMEALIEDWRGLFRQKIPFIYVQLAGFSDGIEENQGTVWAKLRAAQEQVLEVEQTGMVTAFDIGEYNDLHPLNKKTLGYRVSLQIRNLVYQEDLICKGPVVSGVRADQTGRLHVTFDSIGTGLCTRGKDVYEVEVRNEEGTYYSANAYLDGDELSVKATQIRNPKGIRYAWRDCPMNANLYNKEGLPAFPFCREWE